MGKVGAGSWLDAIPPAAATAGRTEEAALPAGAVAVRAGIPRALSQRRRRPGRVPRDVPGGEAARGDPDAARGDARPRSGQSRKDEGDAGHEAEEAERDADQGGAESNDPHGSPSRPNRPAAPAAFPGR